MICSTATVTDCMAEIEANLFNRSAELKRHCCDVRTAVMTTRTAVTCCPYVTNCLYVTVASRHCCPTLLLSHVTAVLTSLLSHVTAVARHCCPHVTDVPRHYCPTSLLSHVTAVPRHYCPTSLLSSRHYCPYWDVIRLISHLAARRPLCLPP